MIKLYLTVTAILMLIITIAAGIIKPGINKPVHFAGSDFEITNTELARHPEATHEPPAQTAIVNTGLSDTKTVEKIIETTAPKTGNKTQIIETKSETTTITKEVKIQPQKTKTTTKTVTTSKPQTVTKTVTKPAQKTSQQTKNVAPSAPEQKSQTVTTAQLPQSVKNILTGAQSEKPEKEQKTEPVKELPKTTVLPDIQPTKTPEQIVQDIGKEDRPLTEQEEIIVWNIWRSNLQNRIMRDTKISAPLGTTFKFSFTVDKRGRISNLKTWASPSDYNTVAVNYLKPLILSYQGQSILNFPSRTKRVITNVTGGFVISTEDKFSTPGDFSDIEKIKTYK